MEYSREQHQALRNIDIQSVCERFSLTMTDDKRIKNAVDVLVFIKGVPFAEAVPMLAEAFPEVLEGILPELPPAREKKSKQQGENTVTEPENLTFRAQKAFFAGVRCSLYDIMLLPQVEDRKKIQILGNLLKKTSITNSNTS